MSKKIVIILVVVLLVNVIWFMFVGYQWSWGPFSGMHDIKTKNLEGNKDLYGRDTVIRVSSPLEGKKLVFLGSSVTYGAASCGESFVDFLEAETGCVTVKEAVSGTTLVDDKNDSYISRFKLLQEAEADIFICQLSTNDATQNKTLGDISESKNIEDFYTHTVAGAMEYIIAYAKNKWNCPVVFYTNPKYDSNEYQAMVELTLKLQEKWDIIVIDMWNDNEFNAAGNEYLNLYMADSIHPTKAGYLKWWLPYMKETLENLIQE